VPCASPVPRVALAVTPPTDDAAAGTAAVAGGAAVDAGDGSPVLLRRGKTAGGGSVKRRAVVDSDSEDDDGGAKNATAAPPVRPSTRGGDPAVVAAARAAKGAALSKVAKYAAAREAGGGGVRDMELDGHVSNDGDDDGDASLSTMVTSSEEDDSGGDASDDDDAPAKKPKKAAPAAKAPPKAPAAKKPAPKPAVAATPATKAGALAAMATASPGGSKGLAAADDVARFEARAKTRFPWLFPPLLRDAAGRPPSDAQYDGSTLQLPAGFPKCRTTSGEPFLISPAQEQWWRLKAGGCFDCVLLFKVGKFYELFEMDAHVGVSVLNLAYMSGDQPHAGFPEASFEASAERLARAGCRVCVAEQTETPKALAARKAATGAKDKVVSRQKVALYTPGTLTEPAMLAARPDAAHCVALCELGAPQNGGDGGIGDVVIGFCAADAATGRFLLGSWVDDAARTQLRGALAELRPVEVVLPRQHSGAGSSSNNVPSVTSPTLTALRCCPAPPVERALPAPSKFWDAAKTCEELQKGAYFDNPTSGAGAFASWPPLLARLAATGGCGYDGLSAAALAALGGMVSHLRDSLLDKDLLPLGRFAVMTCPGGDVDAAPAGTTTAAKWAAADFMSLDAAALDGLEILENSADGGTAGTLLSALDTCVTPAGRRRLRGWLVRPLRQVGAITERQHAIAHLKQPPGTPLGSAVQAARGALRGAPDLERGAARLASLAGGRGRNACHVVLYEDNGRKKLNTLLACLRGAKAVVAAAAAFDAVRGDISSGLLSRLVIPQPAAAGSVSDASGEVAMPCLGAILAEFQSAFDWDKAEKDGRVTLTDASSDPALGVALASVDAAHAALQEWLTTQRKMLGASGEVCFVSSGKDTHQLEVPDRLASRVPGDWHKASTRKGFTRYTCSQLETLKQSCADALDAKEAALAGVLSTLLARAASHFDAFAAAADAAATLDALISLAAASVEFGASGDVCTPTVLPAPSNPSDPVLFEAKALRHPCASVLAQRSWLGGGAASRFVPNDVALSSTGATVLVLTGPNMGGKTTLLRTTCLAAVLAHLGCDVPAASMTITAVDALFVRTGARDDLASGRSTFAVELEETGALLRRATRHSLCCVDELGRGTSTHDGAAIAQAVLSHLASTCAPRTLFSTHYHALCASDAGVGHSMKMAHMGFRCVRPPGATAADDDAAEAPLDDVTFLYVLTPGTCPKSYGVNVARLAGLPHSVLSCAAAKAAAVEKGSGGGATALTPAEVDALRGALGAMDM
jgi:DNA mismatch repair protein MSH6